MHEENDNYTATISVKFEGVREIDITLGSLTLSYERSTCWPLHKGRREGESLHTKYKLVVTYK
jgi:hypothetical protein